MRTLTDVLAALPAGRRVAVQAKTRVLVEAETLRQLRAHARRTQAEVAAATGISQYNVSRLERRADMRLSTLSSYVKGLGGQLHLVAELPEAGMVKLDLVDQPRRPKAPKASGPAPRTRRQGNTEPSEP